MAKDYYMTQNEWKTFNQDEKLFKTLSDNRFYCQCGHSVIIAPKTEKVLCGYCKHLIYRDKDQQQEYNLKIEKEREILKQYSFKKEMRKRLK